MDVLNAIKNVLADVSSVSYTLSEQLKLFIRWVLCCSDEDLRLKTSANTFFTVFSISTSIVR